MPFKGSVLQSLKWGGIKSIETRDQVDPQWMRNTAAIALENLGKAILRPSLHAMVFVAIIYRKITILGLVPTYIRDVFTNLPTNWMSFWSL